MKILFLVESLDVGGTELSLLKWLRHCDRDTFEPSIISFRDGALRETFANLNVKTTIISKKFPFDLSFFFRLVQELNASKADLIHCRNGIPAISYGVLAARILNIPVISSIHGRTHYLKTNLKTKVWFKIMSLSQHIITVTEGIKEDVVRYSGITPERVTVIYNGINSNANPIPASKEDLRREFGLSPNDFVLGTVGSLRPIKGHKYLLEALSGILKEVSTARLVLIGKGAEEKNLQNLAGNLQIADRIHFLGHREDAGRLIGMFDVFVLSSLSEGFPNVLLEAMTAGTPVVATDVGGVTEIVRHGREALVIKPADAKAIADAVVQLALQPDLRKSLTKNALAHAQESFDIRTTLALYDEIYLRTGRKIPLEKSEKLYTQT